MLSHKGTKTINTDRLLLRKVKIEDALDMFKNWANDSEVTRFLTWKPHGSLDATKERIEFLINEYKNINFYDWVIELKEIGEIIGGISVVNSDDKNGSCEIGYCISKDHWGKGIMTEALEEVIDFLFTEVGCNRITAKHDTNNSASGKVMIKSGMKYEGTLRQVQMRENNEFYDLALYAILKKDWIIKNS